MDKTKIRSLRTQIAKWRKYEPPTVIAGMVADQVMDSIAEFRNKNTQYLTKQLKNIQVLKDVLAAKASFVDPAIQTKAALRFQAMPDHILERVKPANFTEALVLASECRRRPKMGQEADAAYARGVVFAESYKFDPNFQAILADALVREGSLVLGDMLPLTPVENIDRNTRKIGFVHVDDIVKEICDGDGSLYRLVSTRVNADLGDSHTPADIRQGYKELSNLRVETPGSLEDSLQGLDEDAREEFLKNLPSEFVKKYSNPSAAPATETKPATPADLGDVARSILADRRTELNKEIAAVKGGSK
jgi:hypothetical protein